MEKLLLTVEEAAEALSIGRSALYDLLRLGKIESIRVGRSRRIPRESLHRYVADALAHPDEVNAA